MAVTLKINRNTNIVLGQGAHLIMEGVPTLRQAVQKKHNGFFSILGGNKVVTTEQHVSEAVGRHHAIESYLLSVPVNRARIGGLAMSLKSKAMIFLLMMINK